jgi:CoA:oxalate CoA-transferase
MTTTTTTRTTTSENSTNTATHAPTPAQHHPLDGLTVVEVTSLVAGPAMGSLLQRLGADVIKVEQPGVGEPSRTVSPWGFVNYNLGKKSLSLNLKEVEGQRILHELIKRKADIFIENLGPDVGRRLRFTYDELSKINPRLVYCSIKGFASGSRLYEKPAFDAVAQALSGMMSLTGEPGGEPVRVGNPSVDLGAAAYGAVCVLASLIELGRTGLGAFVEIPLLDMSIYWNGYWLTYFGMTGNAPERLGSGHPGYSPHKVFRTKDGRHLFLAALSDSQWEKLRSMLNLSSTLDDRFSSAQYRLKHRSEVEGEIARAISKLDLEEALELLDRDVPCAKVNTVPEVYNDDELNKRKVLVDARIEGGRTAKVVVPPIYLFHSGGERREEPLLPADHQCASSGTPRVGQDTNRILTDLGYVEDEIEGLRARRVV